MPWLPVIENGDVSGAIITSPMHESFIAGNFNMVPILTGYNSEEVLTFITSNKMCYLFGFLYTYVMFQVL